MNEELNCLITHHGLAFATGAIIFILTILLVTYRAIGFVTSLVLMLIALGASWSVDNQETVRSYFEKWMPATGIQSPSTKSSPSTYNTPTYIPEATKDNLKGQVELQKERGQPLIESVQKPADTSSN